MAAAEASNLTSMETIIVASQNPVKISAAQNGFSRMFPHSTYAIRGVSVVSGVPDQPLSDEETLRGALIRAQNARSVESSADYWIGIEGGIHDDADSLQSFAWVVVIGKEGKLGKARSATYYLPDEVGRLVRGGMELGHADDQVFGQSNSKQKNGSSGLLTGDVVNRLGFYEQAVILALIPFKNPTLTFQGISV
jgi:inosine/xanthosine triphosphatase